MKRYERILLASDYDGTMYQNRQPVSRENIEAVRYFEENGGRFTVVTGRPAHFVLDKAFPVRINAPLIAVNGTMMADHLTEKILEEYPMTGAVLDVLRWADENLPILDGYYCLAEGGEDAVLPLKDMCRMLEETGRTEKVLKVVFHAASAEDGQTILDGLKAHTKGAYRLERSWDKGVEILRADAGKGFMLQRLKERTGADMTVAVGDYENDLSMIRMADIGYAVANALPCVLAAADRVTCAGGECALAKIIEEL